MEIFIWATLTIFKDMEQAIYISLADKNMLGNSVVVIFTGREFSIIRRALCCTMVSGGGGKGSINDPFSNNVIFYNLSSSIIFPSSI
jgi:hypothetical protein